MGLNDELKRVAMDYGEKIYNEIFMSLEDPTKKIEGDAIKIYQELLDWGWTGEFPLNHQQAHDVYVRLIAMTKYRKLKWQ